MQATPPYNPGYIDQNPHDPHTIDCELDTLPPETETCSYTDTVCCSSSELANSALDREARKSAIIDRLMGHFSTFLATCNRASGFTQSANQSNQSSSRASQSSTTNDQSTHPRQSTNHATKRTLQAHDYDDLEEDGDCVPPPKKQKGISATVGSRTQRFACRYFKHNPRKYQHARSCVGPGWETVHRMK